MSLTVLALQYVLNESFLYQLTASLLAYTLINLVLFYRARKRRYQLFRYYGIPGPEASIIDGNYRLYFSNENTCKIDDELRAKNGNTYAYFIGDEPRIVSADLELLKHVFIENLTSFGARMDWMIRGPVDESILFTPTHERWAIMRRAMSPSFTSYKLRGSEASQFIEETIKEMLQYIEDRFASAMKQEEHRIEIDILSLTKAAALQMISHMAVPLPDVRVVENEQNTLALDELFQRATGGFIDLVYAIPFLKRLIELIVNHYELDKSLGLKSRLYKTIDARLAQLRNPKQAKVEDSNLIEQLSRFHHEGRLTKEEVAANCLAVLSAGYDTTSTTLTYVFWALAKHQDVQHKLRADLFTYGCESTYLEQVLDETMRLYPTVVLFTSRKATKTVELNGITIPQGTRVIHNTWLIHRDPQLWPDPLKFNPERFNCGVDVHPCAFAPFGIGARKCLGYSLAILELKMIICDMVMRYKIALVSPHDLELITYSYFLTKPKEKVRLELEKVSHGHTDNK